MSMSPLERELRRDRFHRRYAPPKHNGLTAMLVAAGLAVALGAAALITWGGPTP